MLINWSKEFETIFQEAKEREGYDEILEEGMNKSPSQSGSDEESDIESLHSFHYSPKAVDLPSAIRLAKRLYTLDGFKKSDVSRHLSKKYVKAFFKMEFIQDEIKENWKKFFY